MSEPAGAGRRGARAVAPTRVQRAIARRVAEARATVPALELGAEVNVAPALRRCTEQGSSVSAALVRACALALREHPRANAAYRDGQFELYERVNVGLLVSDEDDLVFATVFDADGKSLKELSAEIEELRRRGAMLAQPQRSGSTFMLSHEDRVGWRMPVVISGHAAALSAGAVREVPVVQERQLVPGHVMTLTLACDHRILYGAPAARFLARIKELLELAEL